MSCEISRRSPSAIPPLATGIISFEESNVGAGRIQILEVAGGIFYVDRRIKGQTDDVIRKFSYVAAFIIYTTCREVCLSCFRAQK